MERTHYPGLEIDIDPTRQRREWLVKRVAWAILYVGLVAIVFGALGKGPISATRTVSDDRSVQIEYEKFVRRHSSDQLRVTAPAKAETVEIGMDSGYLHDIRLEQVTPQPERVIAADDATIFVFNARTNTHLQVKFEYLPARIGPVRGWIATDGGPRLAFDQFVYP